MANNCSTLESLFEAIASTYYEGFIMEFTVRVVKKKIFKHATINALKEKEQNNFYLSQCQNLFF